jgi:hypothetical protein
MVTPEFSEAFFVGAYWDARLESAGASADRLARFLAAIHDIDPLFATWFATGASRTDALRRPLKISPEALAQELRPIGRQPAFSVSMWNGQRDEVGLRVTCGATPRTPKLGNTVVLDLPSFAGDTNRSYTRAKGLALMQSLVSCWEPTWATFSSSSLRELQRAGPREVLVGWCTYLSDARRPRRLKLPPGATAQDAPAGLLIVLDGEPGSLDPLVTVAIREALGKAVRPPGL